MASPIAEMEYEIVTPTFVSELDVISQQHVLEDPAGLARDTNMAQMGYRLFHHHQNICTLN
jgi:hypothetical protein